MERGIRTPRDKKWLLPAMETEGRSLRNKRKVEKIVSEEQQQGSISKRRRGTTNNTDDKAQRNSKAKPRKQTCHIAKRSKTKLPKERLGNKVPKQDLKLDKLKTKVTNNDTKDNRDSTSKDKGNKSRFDDEKDTHETDTVSTNLKAGRKLKKPVVTERLDVKKEPEEPEAASEQSKSRKVKGDGQKRKKRVITIGKYSCNFCGDYFIKETSLAEHIKWKHNDVSIERKNDKETEFDAKISEDSGTASGENGVNDTAENDSIRQLDEATEPAEHGQNKSDNDENVPTVLNETVKAAATDADSNDLYEKFLPESVCVVNKECRKMPSCPFCHKKFSSDKCMKTHVELACQETPYKCGICLKGLLSPGYKHAHRRKKYEKKKQYYIKQADQPKPYSCPHCQQGFSFKVTLDNHLLVCKEENKAKSRKENRVECQICHKNLSKIYFKNHMLSHKGEARYTCEICGIGFKVGTRLWGHIMSKHKGQKFPCKNCGAVFTQKAALQNHQNVLFGKCKSDKEYKAGFKCVLCSRTFTSLRWLTRHQESHTVNEDGQVQTVREFCCNICDKKFKNKHEKIRHERIHTNVKPNKCTECEMAFVQKGNLQAHMRIHTGERPFACHLCPKAFTQGSNLKVHLYKHQIGKIPAKNGKKANKKKYKDSTINVDRGLRTDATSQTSLTTSQVRMEDVHTSAGEPVILTVRNNAQKTSEQDTITLTISDKTSDLDQAIDGAAELVEVTEGINEVVDLDGKIIFVDESKHESSSELLGNMQIKSISGTADNDIIIKLNIVDQPANIEQDNITEIHKVSDNVGEAMIVATESEGHETVAGNHGDSIFCIAEDNIKVEHDTNATETENNIVYISEGSVGLDTNNSTGHVSDAPAPIHSKDRMINVADQPVDVGHEDSSTCVSFPPDNTAPLGVSTIAKVGKVSNNLNTVISASDTDFTVEESLVPDTCNNTDQRLNAICDLELDSAAYSNQKTETVPKDDVPVKEAACVIVSEKVKESSQIVQDVLEDLCK